MTRKRGWGEGTVAQLPSGKWRAQVWIDGERLGKTMRTKRNAQNWIREIKNELDRGLGSDGFKLFYGTFLDEWLKVKKQNVEAQTHRYYKQIIEDYIKPELGNLKIRDITSRRIQKLYNDFVEDGVGLRTIEKTHSIIHASMNTAIKYGLIKSNPDRRTEPPRPKKKEMKYLSREDVQKFLEDAKKSGDRNLALFYIAIVTGMRQGELLGLKWCDVDLENGVIAVKRTLKRVPGGGLMLDKPKTEKSRRSIKIGKEGIEILMYQKYCLESEKEEKKELWREEGFVFPSTIGTAMDPSNLVKKFRQALKRAGLKIIRFHDLRHTSAALMLNNGVDILVASRRLGHAKPSITLDVYGHLLSSEQNEVANKIEELVS